jgi:hypothetical protein
MAAVRPFFQLPRESSAGLASVSSVSVGLLHRPRSFADSEGKELHAPYPRVVPRLAAQRVRHRRPARTTAHVTFHLPLDWTLLRTWSPWRSADTNHGSPPATKSG